jgi:membrane fusion protein (multidrug efflux system)
MVEPLYPNTAYAAAPVSKKRHLFRWMVIMIIAVLVVAGFIGYKKYAAFQGFKTMAAAMKNPPQTVSAVKAGFQSWQTEIKGVGTLRAVNGVDLAFETPGIIDTLHFNSGDDVAAGTVLLTLRLNDEPGKLESLKAQQNLAEIVLARDQKQFAAQAVAQATIDSDEANLRNLKAQVAEVQAQIDEKVIKAPFAGHLGIRQVDLGQYVQAGTAIVTLQALDPIYIDFYLPQQALDQLKIKAPVAVKIDTYPNDTFAGEISAINPKIDQSSRNVQVRASIKNPQHKLFPGMYGTVLLQVGQPQNYLTIPQTAVTFNPYGSTVYLVSHEAPAAAPDAVKAEADKPVKAKPAAAPPSPPNAAYAKQIFITTGETRGDQVAVLTGLSEGDEVVTSGQNKLHPGVPLLINNSIQPTDNPNPTPQDH